MGIRHVHPIYFGCITIYRFFGNRVRNLLPVFILGKIIEAPLPAVGCGNYKSLAFDRLFICKKLNLDGLWSLAILVVCVIPSLLTGNLCCFRSVSIGHVHTIYFGGVTFYYFLGNCVLNLIIIFVFGKTVKAPLPTIFFCDREQLAINCFCIS